MFLHNNEKIDVEILRNRVLGETNTIKRRLPCGPAVAAPLGQLRLAQQKKSQQLAKEAKLKAADFKQLTRKISTWIWCFIHLPRIYTTVSRNFDHQAEEASRNFEQQAKALDRQVHRLESLSLALVDLEQKLNSHVDRSDKAERLAVEALQVTERGIAGLKREIMFQQRRLTRLAEVQAVAVQGHSDTINHRLDSFYVAFEDVFRGTREDIKGRIRPYLDRLVLSGAGQPGKPIVDIGCGRGEWLEILKENHLQAYGIDANVMMVERARLSGLDVREADLVAHLRELPDASRSAITAFHVIEHLRFGVMVDFLDEALRALMPGGMLILETPNPENLRVGACAFYNDPTHRHPIPPELLRFLVEHRGFAETEIVRLHPFPVEEHLEASNADARRLNDLLFGPQDYAIIARRA
jgi:2-polyprenyl-3-methyl-5-hydroxy-6-metoxy-1,4-benzoquinol methylase